MSIVEDDGRTDAGPLVYYKLTWAEGLPILFLSNFCYSGPIWIYISYWFDCLVINALSGTGQIFNLRILNEQYLQHQQGLYHVFIDFMKAFDRV